MTIAQSLLPEFEQEMANTRQVLERVPDDRFNWRAHPRSNTIGWNANHLAEIPEWCAGAINLPSWEVDGHQSPQLATTREVLELFDRNVAAGREALERVADEALRQDWSLLLSGAPLFTMPRAAVIRIFVLNHSIHHRAHLCVYLRLIDVPVPGLYGPSGDD